MEMAVAMRSKGGSNFLLQRSAVQPACVLRLREHLTCSLLPITFTSCVRMLSVGGLEPRLQMTARALPHLPWQSMQTKVVRAMLRGELNTDQQLFRCEAASLCGKSL